MSLLFDTIAAVATAPGLGGIGIVRISGSLSVFIINSLFRDFRSIQRNLGQDTLPKKTRIKTRRIHYGFIVDPENQKVVDEVIVLFMRAPLSYTREDIIEIQSHAGSAVLQKILSLVLDAGARLAEPGEFTRRAFLQGRIDLTQAEAVADLINAKTEAAMNMATRQLIGGMHHAVDKIRQQLQMVAGHLEASIEFPEEMSDESAAPFIFTDTTKAALDAINALLQTFSENQIYRDGIQLSIIGRPNVGKSSLLNSLLEKERAIVTALPGTTRDLVIDSFQIKGIPIQITDTAGIRFSENPIEKLGLRKTEESIDTAQLILFVVDAKNGGGAEDEEIYSQISQKTALIVINKADLVDGEPLPPKWKPNSTPYVTISAKYRKNIEKLKEKIVNMITRGDTGPSSDQVVPNIRQKHALVSAVKDINHALAAFNNGESEEFIIFHLQRALNDLGTITGETHTDDLLDVIFDRFCIGK